jgi:hypothetical protein
MIVPSLADLITTFGELVDGRQAGLRAEIVALINCSVGAGSRRAGRPRPACSAPSDAEVMSEGGQRCI